MKGVTLIYGNDPFIMLPKLLETGAALAPVRSDDSVMIKPNLVASRRDWAGVNTDPRVVEALQMDRLLMGINPVEVDSVVADMLGYAPRNIRHIGDSAEAGLGICDLKKIRIRALINRPLRSRKIFGGCPH